MVIVLYKHIKKSTELKTLIGHMSIFLGDISSIIIFDLFIVRTYFKTHVMPQSGTFLKSIEIYKTPFAQKISQGLVSGHHSNKFG